MPIRDVSAQTKALRFCFGADRSALAPDAFEVVLFSDSEFTTELDPIDCPGYVRADLDSDDITDFEDGAVTIPVQFADVTGEWTTGVLGAGLWDPVAGEMYDVVELSEPLEVTGPGDGPLVVLTVFYDSLGLDL